jgi:hypothetical protein
MSLIYKAKFVDGLFYPEYHPGWGGCAEELFHYTSRYFAYTEAFLRNLADQRQFNMSGYQAANLNNDQRRLMAAILAEQPGRRSARDITQIVRGVIHGESPIYEELTTRYHDCLKTIPIGVELVYSDKHHQVDTPEVAPLDPFLNMASRLRLPVAVRDHHVVIPLRELAKHLDSTHSSLRNSLQEAIVQLHFAGYQLKNHPGLTHKTAKSLRTNRQSPPLSENESPSSHSHLILTRQLNGP